MDLGSGEDRTQKFNDLENQFITKFPVAQPNQHQYPYLYDQYGVGGPSTAPHDESSQTYYHNAAAPISLSDSNSYRPENLSSPSLTRPQQTSHSGPHHQSYHPHPTGAYQPPLSPLTGYSQNQFADSHQNPPSGSYQRTQGSFDPYYPLSPAAHTSPSSSSPHQPMPLQQSYPPPSPSYNPSPPSSSHQPMQSRSTAPKEPPQTGPSKQEASSASQPGQTDVGSPSKSVRF